MEGAVVLLGMVGNSGWVDVCWVESAGVAPVAQFRGFAGVVLGLG